MDHVTDRAGDGHDDALTNVRKAVQDRFHVLGMHVQAVRRDDQVFLAALVIEDSSLVQLPDVAGSEPALVQDVTGLALGGQVLGGDILSTDQDFAIRSQTNLLAPERTSQGASPRSKRVVDGHDRTGLGQAVPLDHRITKLRPPLFLPRLKPGPAHDHGPELPAEHPVHPAVFPPAGGHPRQPAPRHMARGHLDAGADPALQIGQDPGDRNQDGDPVAADAAQDRGRMEFGGEHCGATQDDGNKEAQRLTEHVAQGQEIQETNRLERPGVFPVAVDLTGEGGQVGADVPVPVDDTLGRSRGP